MATPAAHERPLKRGPSISQPTARELGAALLDRVLERGDCLAIPRGFPHAAESVDAESTHLTIGIMALTWNRVMRDVIDDIASGSALADRLPFGGLGGLDAAGGPRPDEAIHTLCDQLTGDRLRHAVAAEVWRRQPQTRLRLRRPVAIDVGQPMAVTAGPLLWLDARPAADGKHAINLGDRRLRFPAECTPFVTAVLQSPATFSGASLPGQVDDASRVAILSRLATEGVIRG